MGVSEIVGVADTVGVSVTVGVAVLVGIDVCVGEIVGVGVTEYAGVGVSNETIFSSGLGVAVRGAPEDRGIDANKDRLPSHPV